MHICNLLFFLKNTWNASLLFFNNIWLKWMCKASQHYQKHVRYTLYVYLFKPMKTKLFMRFSERKTNNIHTAALHEYVMLTLSYEIHRKRSIVDNEAFHVFLRRKNQKQTWLMYDMYMYYAITYTLILSQVPYIRLILLMHVIL